MSPSKGHYHKQVDVRVPLRLTVGMRSEQDNFLRVKLARDLRAELFDLSGSRFPKDMMSRSLHLIQVLVDVLKRALSEVRCFGQAEKSPNDKNDLPPLGDGDRNLSRLHTASVGTKPPKPIRSIRACVYILYQGL